MAVRHLAESGTRSGDPLRTATPGLRLRLVKVAHELELDECGFALHQRPAADHRTEDVARTLSLAAGQAGDPGLGAGTRGALTLLEQALNVRSGRFRALRRADGVWSQQDCSLEAHARILRSLSKAAVDADDLVTQRHAARMFAYALPASAAFRDHRALAHGVLACAEALDAPLVGGAAATQLNQLGVRLASVLEESVRLGGPEWPWPAPVVSASSAVVPHALIHAAELSGRSDWLRYGLVVLRWLVSAQMGPERRFSFIGSQGWWRRGASPARFEQHPIEALTMLEASIKAYEVTGDESWAEVAEAAFAWFLGENDLGLALADTRTGACHDGLQESGLNPACSTDSTLDWLASVNAMQGLRQRHPGLARPLGSRRRLAS